MRVFNFFFYLTYLGQLVKPRYEGSVVISLMYFYLEHLFITNYFSIIFHPIISSISNHLNCSNMSSLIQRRVEEVL